MTKIHECQQKWACLGCERCTGHGFSEWYGRFCEQAPAMSTEELMKEAFLAGINQRASEKLHLKRGSKISKKELDKLIAYAESCGYPVRTTVSDYASEYTINHPHYQCTPLAESSWNSETRRWTHWMFIRL